jgi:hypothetical protein
MNNQHVGLSQILAEQRTSELQEQATHERLLRATPQPRRRHASSARSIAAIVALTVFTFVGAGPAATAYAPGAREQEANRVNTAVAPRAVAQPSSAFVLARKLEREFAQQQAEATGINPYSGRPYPDQGMAAQPSPAYEEHRKLERDWNPR